MDTLKKAKELGILIAQSEELKTLKESKVKLEQDKKARSLMDEYEQLKTNFFENLKGITWEERMQHHTNTKQKEEEMNEYSVTKHYFDSKKRFDDLTKKAEELVLQSQEFKTLQESEALADQDEKALALEVEYKQILRELIHAEIGMETKEGKEQLKEKLDQKEKEINEYDVSRKFFEDKKKLNDLIDNVNKIIENEVKDSEYSYSSMLWRLKRI